MAGILFVQKYFFVFKILSHFWQRLVEEAGPSAREPVVVPPLDDVVHTTTLLLWPVATVAAATATCVVGRVVVSRAAFHPPYALLHTPVGARRPTMLLAAAALLRICEGGIAPGGWFFCDPATSPQSDLFTAQ